MRTFSIVSLFVATLTSGWLAHAAVPADFNSQNWERMLAKAVTEGSVLETGNGTYRTLSQVTPDDPEAAHQAEYFSVVGGVDPNGQFQVGHVETVSENWRFNADGNWDIDQWLFNVARDGHLIWAAHFHLVETKDRAVLADDSLKATPDEQMQAWTLRYDQWNSRTASPQGLAPGLF